MAERVTPERLVHARSEPQNWLTYYGAYDGQRYSTLDQITAANVDTLKPAWVFATSPCERCRLVVAPRHRPISRVTKS